MAGPSKTGRSLGCGFFVVVGIVLFVILSEAIHIVPAGYRGIVFSSLSGLKENVVLKEGMNFVTPFVDHPQNYEVRTRTFAFSSSGIQEGDGQADAIMGKTSDAQTVYIDLTVRYHLDPEQVWRLHREVEGNYEDRIIRPTAEGEAREVVAGYDAEEVFSTKRQEVEDAIAAALSRTFGEKFLVLDEVLLRNVAFTPEYHHAIEQKQIAQQRAQKKTYEILKQQREKQRKIIEARGEADAIDIRGYALAKYPQVVQYEYVKGLPDRVPTYITSGDTIVSLSDLLSRAKQE